MVNFGKKLMKDQIPEWKRCYINYKLMKKKVRQYAEQTQNGGKDRRQVLKDFSRMLDDQIEKIVLFLLEQQGLLASRIEKLGEERVNLSEQPDFSKISELCEAYKEVGLDLVKLLKFVDLNATGIRKILKKFDKRFGYRFTDYYVTSRANHPYSQLQQVFKHVGLGAIVGALSRNLADLQYRQGSYLSIYDQPSDALKDPIIDLINASVDKLTHSTNFLKFLGQHALIIQEELPSSGEDEALEANYHFMSLLLNLANTFLYMVNTYIIVPTADDYSLSLGAAPTVCGIIIGSMAVAQVFSSVYFSAWSNRSYFKPLIFSSIVLFFGNVLYALAYDGSSLTILLLGRLFCGLGSARAVNRRYISDCVPLKIRMQASAGFVSASALGMACGPAIAGLLQTNFKIYSLTINQNTLPGWVMALSWLIYLIWLLISFKEPTHDNVEKIQPQDNTDGHVGIGEMESGLAQPLLLIQKIKKMMAEKNFDDSEEAPEDSRMPANSICSAYRLLTPSVKISHNIWNTDSLRGLVGCFFKDIQYRVCYINYKLMKKKVRQYAEQTQNGGKDRRQVLKDFSRMLDDQATSTSPLTVLRRRVWLRRHRLKTSLNSYPTHTRGRDRTSIPGLRLDNHRPPSTNTSTGGYLSGNEDLVSSLMVLSVLVGSVSAAKTRLNKCYINYKLMKKKVRQYAEQTQNGGKDRRQVLKDFSRMLDDQIEKIVLFLLEQQGLLASRIEKLGEERVNLSEQPDFSKISELCEAYKEVGLDLVKLLKFVDLNATGIRKILKKFDKRFGYRFTDYYVTSRANHPYSQLQQVFKHVGLGAIVGALSRNLADLQYRQGSYLSIYDQPSDALKDPIIDLINASVDKLTHSTNFLKFLGQHLWEDEALEANYHFMSLLLNLANTFLYMVNTYIIVPTADDYSLSLGAAPTVCGIIIGSMAVAQVFSSVYFSAWSNRSYFKPLIFSSIVLFFGNVLYALAYDGSSLTILLLGRLFCGLGSARAVNRRYISDCVPLKIRMQASAGFVSASALGMACGPAIAGLLQTNFKIYSLTINQNTLPGWVMALSWLIYLIWLLISFKEPTHDNVEKIQPQDNTDGHVGIGEMESGLAQPLLLNSEDKENDGGEEFDDSEEAPEDSRMPANSICSAYRLLTPSVKVQLLIYFMLKFGIEILLSESSVITSYYFKWTTSSVAIFLAILGLTVLPVNAIVGSYISNLFEDRKILLASEIMMLVGIALSFHVTSSYTVIQYVSSALITFVSAEVLEGVNLSLLSRVMSSRLARGTYNGGLLSTEAGTLARVAADGMITLAGFLGESKLLNVTLLPSVLICIVSIAATFLTFNSLF
ncbi:hypothetical protein KFK09_020275 [Dendrobium nobile]|uniref:SPX domain-containing protein n=1 Tax=Dendrobium nobile TaxID=94219 RepID=A0A8T3AUH9_DENNO|nr:hypothetical protein KFK09_020275 [Dendrobium nobile]